MNIEDEDFELNFCKENRNLREKGINNKRWNKKEVARRNNIISKRENQKYSQQEDVEVVPQIQVPIKQKKYGNGKVKVEKQKSLEKDIEVEIPQIKTNKKKEKNMRRQ